MSGTHALVAPSGLAITMQCPRSLGLQLLVPNIPTPESMEGDAAHWLALMASRGIDPRTFKGTQAPNGTTIDQDMVDGAILWAETVGEGGIAEECVSVPRISRHCSGTPDNRRYDPLAQVLRVWDYKYGHRWVEVFRIAQLMAYAAGEMDRLGLPWTHQTYVRLCVVQPRSYGPEGPVREWGCYANELLPMVEEIRARVALAIDEETGEPRADAVATTGPECVDCKARHACPTFQGVAARIVDASAMADLHELTTDQLGAELSYLDAAIERLKARRDGLAVQAEVHLASGRRVNGYEMGEGRANEKWNAAATVETVAAFGAALDAQLVRPAELLTPKQARDEIKRRKLAPQLLDQYIERPRGKMSLQASSTIRAQKVFGVTGK